MNCRWWRNVSAQSADDIAILGYVSVELGSVRMPKGIEASEKEIKEQKKQLALIKPKKLK